MQAISNEVEMEIFKIFLQFSYFAYVNFKKLLSECRQQQYLVFLYANENL